MDFEKAKPLRNFVLIAFMVVSTVDISMKLYTYFNKKKYCNCGKQKKYLGK